MSASCSNCSTPAVDHDKIAQKVKKASSSFYWAMRILAKPQRQAIFAVYAFCRAVDDVADGPIALDVKKTALDRWGEEIKALYDPFRQPTFTIVQALKQPVEDFGLQQQDFLAVIDGMKMDANGPVMAPDMKTLDLYCDRVAGAVGRLCVAIFGEPGETGLALAHHQGRALQLTNILRDVAEDAREGRLYLPKELLGAHNIDYRGIGNPGAIMGQQGFVGLWRELAEMANDEFAKTYQYLESCDKRKMRASYIMADIYQLNLKRMMALDDAQISNPDFNRRLVGKMEKLLIAGRRLWA